MIPHMLPRVNTPAARHGHQGCTVELRHAWESLRYRFHEDHDRWSERELAHLRFLRWLAESGRLAADGYRPWDGAAPAKHDAAL